MPLGVEVNRLARMATEHARWVLAACLLVVVAGAVVASGLSGALSQSFAVPGQPGYEANQKIAAQYGGGGETAPTVIAVQLPPGAVVNDPDVTAGLSRGTSQLAASLRQRATAAGTGQLPEPRVVAYRGPRDDVLVSSDRHTTYVLVFAYGAGGLDSLGLGQEVGQQFAARADLPAGSQVYVTGVDVLRNTGSEGQGSVLAETLIAAAGALIVLAFVFGSFLAVVPLVTAAVSIMATFILVRGLTLFTDVSAIVQFLVALIGLGVAIDYALLIVTRWREERSRGRSNAEAVTVSVRTAGHSVVFSGVTVAVGLLALVLLPVPFLRSVGYGGVLIPLVSIVVNLTLLPALLITLGPFLDRPRRKKARPASEPSRAWTWWARTVVRFRWAAAAIGLGALVLLAVAALSLRVGTPETTALESTGPATSGVRLLESDGLGRGAMTPIEVLTTTSAAPRVRERLSGVSGVAGVVETGRTPSSVVLDVIPDDETSSPGGQSTLDRVSRTVQPLPAQVGGLGASTQSFNDAVYGAFPLMLGLIVLITLVLLTRAFRSILLALKAVVLNLLSVAATYGLLTLVWQDGYGSQAIWGVPATGAITDFVPLMVFAFLFGLSMDYEVFILARMRESFDTHKSTSRAILDGIGHTGKLVTSAALILFLAFLSLSLTPNVELKVFATALGAGILLDATIVRALLVPALVSLFGRWNWWLPTGVARILRVEPSTTTYLKQPPAPCDQQVHDGEGADRPVDPSTLAGAH